MSGPYDHLSLHRTGLMQLPRAPLLVLIVLNGVVLLGQLWPEGAPPFARIVNVGFLLLSLAFFCWLLLRRSRSH